MRILIFGIDYRPEVTAIGPDAAGLAEHPVARGDDVTVITGLPSYLGWRLMRGTPRRPPAIEPLVGAIRHSAPTMESESLGWADLISRSRAPAGRLRHPDASSGTRIGPHSNVRNQSRFTDLAFAGSADDEARRGPDVGGSDELRESDRTANLPSLRRSAPVGQRSPAQFARVVGLDVQT
jgi:hypothetical protein